MTQLYHGICLPEKNKEVEKSRENYYQFKNFWILRECWLHTLWEDNKIPQLDYFEKFRYPFPECLLPSGIYIPDNFEPSEQLKNHYRKKFNYHLQVLIKKWQKEGFDFLKEFRKPNQSGMDFWYKASIKPFVIYERMNKIDRDKAIRSLSEHQKISMLLSDSTFMCEMIFPNPIKDFSSLKIGESIMNYKLTKRTDYTHSKKVVKRNK